MVCMGFEPGAAGETTELWWLPSADMFDGHVEATSAAYYVSSLTNRIASSANIEFHARIVAQKYL